jgi:beta-lactam-binding protein with PASTA domain
MRCRVGAWRRIALLFLSAGIAAGLFAAPAWAETRERNSEKDPGTVLSSSPPKGANRPAGKKVALTLAK